MWSNIAILGMGRSGRSAAKLALQMGMRVSCIDSNENCTPIPGCTLFHDRSFTFEGIELLVVSPGVPAEHHLIQEALQLDIPVLGELAFAAHYIHHPLLAITGTNGKSSTAWYTHQLLSQTHHRPFIGGNFGIALSEMALEPEKYTIGVVEVSSYQLEFPGGFHPKAACILNLTPDHLARHKTMDIYRTMKKRIAAQQGPEDILILPKAAPELRPVQDVSILYFDAEPGCVIQDGQLLFRTEQAHHTIPTEGLSILGKHNLHNIAAASLLCLAVDIDLKELDYAKITALEHRLETIPTRDGLFWINDSKATNIEATQAALQSLSAPLIVLLGGAGKDGADYRQLHSLLENQATHVLCFGASGEEIQSQLAICQGNYALELCLDLQESISLARRIATAEHQIILSPACASFDQFDNFEHRGRSFVELLRQGEKA